MPNINVQVHHGSIAGSSKGTSPLASSGPRSIRFERVREHPIGSAHVDGRRNTQPTSRRVSTTTYPASFTKQATIRDSVDGEPSVQQAQLQRAQKDYVPSLNRMLVDLRKLDYFSDPNSVLFNLRNTLEEQSKKQVEDSRRKINDRVRNARNSS